MFVTLPLRKHETACVRNGHILLHTRSRYAAMVSLCSPRSFKRPDIWHERILIETVSANIPLVVYTTVYMWYKEQTVRCSAHAPHLKQEIDWNTGDRVCCMQTHAVTKSIGTDQRKL